MEVSNGYGVGCGADQLFLASAVRCELGAWAILSRAACGAGDVVLGGLFGGCAGGGLLAHAFGFAVVGGPLAAFRRLIMRSLALANGRGRLSLHCVVGGLGWPRARPLCAR